MTKSEYQYVQFRATLEVYAALLTKYGSEGWEVFKEERTQMGLTDSMWDIILVRKLDEKA